MCEYNDNNMNEVLACRACLATDVKLYNMYKYNLVTAYEMLTATQISSSDGLPLQLCSFCSALLLKCASFQERCRNVQQLLNYAVLEENSLTTDYICNIDRETHNLTLPYSVEHQLKQENFTKEENNISDNNFEDDDEECIKFEENIKFEEHCSTSDEEPLSKKIVRTPHKKKRRKKHKGEEKFTDDIKVKNEIVDTEEFDDHFDTLDDEKQNLEYFETNDDVDVIILSKQQQIEEIQSRRKSLNYINSLYKCDKCYKGFITEATFNNHMSRHDLASGAHACEVCHTRWRSARALRAHALAAHERQYACRRCDHVAKSSHRAKEHCKWHEGFVYVCDICGATFSKSTSHLTHVRLQHPSGPACELCGDSFIGQYGLNMHRKKAHRDTAESEAVQCESRCSSCGEQFRSAGALDAHRAAAAGAGGGACDPRLKWCSVCGQGCGDDGALQEHLRGHARREHAVKCTHCNRKFANSRTYAVHYQRFHLGGGGARPRGRSACRSPADSAVCEICGKKCMSKATLVYHQRTHTGEKPYQCQECPKRFSIYQRLQIHVRTHTGERPFKCALCPKAFKQKAALNRHDRVHSGAKPYACAHCGKTFSQSNSMKMHVRTVHLKMPAPYRTNRKNKVD